MPVGIVSDAHALSTLFTFWPPAPEDLKVSILPSSGLPLHFRVLLYVGEPHPERQRMCAFWRWSRKEIWDQAKNATSLRRKP
jgi:hypothetical protein